jgi:serine/threonine-protein kinase
VPPLPPLADRYELERELGQGGMATVYLARDLRHDRKVAVKVLRPELAAAIDDRFLREITTTAGLRHPHILPLFDSGQATLPPFPTPPVPPVPTAPTVLYYVMPYVEGESLDDRLRREGRLPVDDALRIAREVADALGYAHAHGVLHRDIKPANILLESGHAVVADFGIARAFQAAGGERLTQAGMAVGTPAYMSPEQAAGEAQLDGRSDLYSLGCVLHEMLTGAPPFSGASAAGVLSRHLTAVAPPVSAARPDLPAGVDAIVARLLAKEPDRRFPGAPQLISALDEVLAPLAMRAGGERAQAAAPRRRVILASLLALAAIALVAVVLLQRRASSAAPAVSLRQVTVSAAVEEYPALSPDGTRLVFSRGVGGVRQLFLLNLADGTETRITTDSSDAIQAAWTPDGAAVVFVRASRPGLRLEPGDVFGVFYGGDIWRRDLGTGAERRLVEAGANPSVGVDGRIVFDADRAGTRRIWIADGLGRNAQQLSNDSSEAVSHVAPRWSPDGRKVVFQAMERTRFDLRVVDVATRASHAITSDAYAEVQPAWDPSGRAVWYTSNRAGGYNLWRMPVTGDGEPDGLPVQMTTGAGEDVQLSVPAGGGPMAFTVLRLNADLWRLPVDPRTGLPTGGPEPVVETTREDSRGAWSPDGKLIAFNSDRAGDMNIWIHSLADGGDRQLTRGTGGDYQPAWSPDGKRIAFFSARAGNADIWTVDVATGALARLTDSPWLEINPSWSPDGSHVAFQSDRGGRLELWVVAANGGDLRQVSRNGAGVGHFLPWDADGRQIYMRNGDVAGTPGRIAVADGTFEPLPLRGGSHMSLAPGGRLVLDVAGHRELWVSPEGGAPYTTFRFEDPAVRVDYPVWSPDGRWILFDRTKPEGGDIWLMEPRR